MKTLILAKKIFVLVCAISVMSGGLWAGASSKQVTILLKGGKGNISGTLIGLESDSVTVKTADGQIHEILAVNVRKMFNDNGERISFSDEEKLPTSTYRDDAGIRHITSAGSDADEADNAETNEIFTTPRHPRRKKLGRPIPNGQETVGKGLFIGGLALAIIGGAVGFSGVQRIQQANAERANGTNYSDIANAQLMETGGFTVAGIGVVAGIAGLIIKSVGRHKREAENQGAGLFNFRNDQFALGLPTISFVGGTVSHLTLAQVEF